MGFTEIIPIMITAKEMGFDIGSMVMLVPLYFVLRGSLKGAVSGEFKKLIAAITELEQAHNKRIETIESHVGIKPNQTKGR